MTIIHPRGSARTLAGYPLGARLHRRRMLGLLSTGAAGLAAFARTTGATGVQDASPVAEEGEIGKEGSLTIYSGRSENLVGELIEQFEADTGIDVAVRYGNTAELAATILEEGSDSPANLFFAQDAGALGLLADEGLFAPLPGDLLDRVDPRFRSRDGLWTGVSGRARVAVYNTDTLSDDDLPASVLDLTDPVWRGRVGWAPENASFQSFVTALRVLEGDDAARAWLEAMQENETVGFGDSNSAIVRAVGAGEVEVGLVNHYYLYAVKEEEGEDFPIANHFFAEGDPGSLVNVAGVGVLANSDEAELALTFVDYLLSEEAQTYFAEETAEYPLIAGVPAAEDLTPLAEVGSPDIDLSALDDLRGTIDLLIDVGLL